MLYKHWRDVPKAQWHWPHFSPKELACKHCGELLTHEPSLDRLEVMRAELGRAMSLSSAYRCPIHNAMVGGAPLSMHKFARAFDIRLGGYFKGPLIHHAKRAGFSGLGLNYKTFLHADTGAKRSW